MLKIYNSLTHQLEEFKPLTNGEVGFYSCGPTVYGYVHIGNLRSFIFADLLHRTLLNLNYKVNFVMNITDVDDKTIKQAQTENKSLKQTTDFYTQVFLEDLDRVNIIVPNKLPRATEEINDMVALIKILLDKSLAYKTDNGDIYFDISKFQNYGQLAQLDAENLKKNAEGRLSDSDEYEKDDVRDFALWKSFDPADGDVFWNTEIGKGRPGWHIECSAMSSKYLGQPFDIHAGGIDLIFPHHTNEIAQSQGAFDKPLANYWLHPEHLLVENTKMAKSKQNFFTSKDLVDKGFDLLAFRYLILTSHYRSKLNFTWNSLKAAQTTLNNLYQETSGFDTPKTPIKSFQDAFDAAINNDIDTPKALAITWDLIRSDSDSGEKLATLFNFDKILGLRIQKVWEESKQIPDSVQKLVKSREQARKDKDFTKSDELRKEIEASGFVLDDTTDGAKLKKKF